MNVILLVKNVAGLTLINAQRAIIITINDFYKKTKINVF